MGDFDGMPREMVETVPAEGGNGMPVAVQQRSKTRSIVLDRLGGDVWSWKKRVTGTCPDCPPDASIAVRVDDSSFPATRDGDAFAALVSLEPGENRVSVVATDAVGEEVESESVIYSVRLRPNPTARIAIRVTGDTIVFDATLSEPSVFDGAPLS